MSGPDAQTLRQWAEAGQWFAKADEDICVAEMALGREPPLIDPAAFHCQQAGEKIIKGLLVAAAIKAPRIHDLEALATLAAPSLSYSPLVGQFSGVFKPLSGSADQFG